MAEIANGRCHAEKAPLPSPPLFQHGSIVFQAHDIGWLVSGCFTLVSMITSFWLINKHLQWYTNKHEQRYIVRILLMVPLYAVISLASYLFWNHSTPLLLLRDCYESTVLTSFFYLLLLYLAPDPEEQKDIFRKLGLSRENDRELRRLGQNPKKWMFPLGVIKWKPEDGLYFLQLMKWGVLQYCVVRPTTTLVAVILDYVGLYCEDSWSPRWAYVYITVIVSISVSIAMYCLLQLYVPVSSLLKPHKPLLKLIAVKTVVFLTFWQASGLSLLTAFNVVKDTPYMTADNINTGIGAILETFEMMIFAFVHIRAFSYKPYCTPPNRTRRLRALAHAFDFRETGRELWAGMQFMWHRYRGRETDVRARRHAALEGVFGRSRGQVEGPSGKRKGQQSAREENLEKGQPAVEVAIQEIVPAGLERQWLGVGDGYDPGLIDHSHHQQEKSDGLGEQIEHELASRVYSRHESTASYVPLGTMDPEQDAVQSPIHRQHTSWWRNVYTRLSQSDRPTNLYIDTDVVGDQGGRSQRQQREFRRMAGRKLAHIEIRDETYEDPPPSSFMRSYRESKSRRTNSGVSPSSSLIHPGSTPWSPILPASDSAPAQLSPAESLATPLSPMSLDGSSDSFLARVFSPATDDSRSTEALTAGATSSQSRRSRVRLSGEPALISKSVVARSPVIMPHPTSRRHTMEHASSQRHSTAFGASVDLSDVPSRPSYSHQRRSLVHATPSSNRPPRSRSHHSRPYDGPRSDLRRSALMAKTPRIRRDQIVLPAPLAPPTIMHPSAREVERLSVHYRSSEVPPTRVLSQFTDTSATSSPTKSPLPISLDGRRDSMVVSQDVNRVDNISTSRTQRSLPPLRRQGATRGKGRRYTDTDISEPLLEDPLRPIPDGPNSTLQNDSNKSQRI